MMTAETVSAAKAALGDATSAIALAATTIDPQLGEEVDADMLLAHESPHISSLGALLDAVEELEEQLDAELDDDEGPEDDDLEDALDEDDEE